MDLKVQLKIDIFSRDIFSPEKKYPGKKYAFHPRPHRLFWIRTAA